MYTSIKRCINSKETRQFLKKYCFVVMFIILAGMVFTVKSIPSVSASTPSNTASIREKVDNIMDGFHLTNVKYMKYAYDQFANYMDYTDEEGVFYMAAKFIKGIAMFFCLIFCLLGIIKESARGEISMDYWTRIFVSTVVAVLLVANVSAVMDSLYKTGGAIIDEMISSTTMFADTATDHMSLITDEQKKDLIHKWSLLPGFNGHFPVDDEAGTGEEEEGTGDGEGGEQDGGNGEGGGNEETDETTQSRVGSLEDVYYGTDNGEQYIATQYLSSLLDPLQLVCLLPLLASMYLIFAMVFEVKIRQLFAPIAVAAIGYEGARSSAVRFLKKYLSCFLRIGIYFIIGVIGASMTHFFYAETLKTSIENNEVTIELASNLILMFASNIIAALTMLQAGSISDEIVGV